MTEQLSLSDDIGFLLSRAGGLVLGSVKKSLVLLGLGVRSYSVLVLACEQSAGVNQRSVSATMGLDPSQIVGLIDELEERELVTRTPDLSDRRNKLIVATDKGRQVRAEAQRQVDEAHSGHFAQLSDSTLERMREVLREIVFGEATGS